MKHGDLYFTGGWDGSRTMFHEYRFRHDPVPWISIKNHWAFINRRVGNGSFLPIPVKRAYYAHKDMVRLKPLPKEDPWDDDYLKPINRNWKAYRKTQWK